MGYITRFTGTITVDPPLNRHEADYLHRFAAIPRFTYPRGPYETAAPDGTQPPAAATRPAPGQPSLGCSWIPTPDGTGITCDGTETFYAAAAWMAYLIEHFLKPNAAAQQLRDTGRLGDTAPSFEHFTFDHHLDGLIHATGEDTDDLWELLVRDNTVTASPTRRISSTTADQFSEAFGVILASEAATVLGCTETELLCGLLTELGEPGNAAAWREAHALGDQPEDQHWALRRRLENQPR